MNITVTDSTSDIVVETVENSTAVTIQQSVVEITSSPGTNDHAHLSNLDYANSGHTGFEASGAASSAIASHVGQADPHTQYALESALPTRLFGGAFTDTVVPGTGDDSKFGRWNNTLQRLEWASVSVAPGGSTGYVQYNNGGVFGASGIYWDVANGRAGIGTATPGYKVDIQSGSTASQVHLSNNGDSGGYLTSATASGIFMSGGAAYNGANWIAKDTTCSITGAFSGHVYFYNNAGLTVGNSFTPVANMRIAAAGGVSIGTSYVGFDSGSGSLIVQNNIGIGITSPVAILDIAASTTAKASLRIRSGTAPTSPNDGDIWFDGTNYKCRIGGVTKTFTVT